MQSRVQTCMAATNSLEMMDGRGECEGRSEGRSEGRVREGVREGVRGQ